MLTFTSATDPRLARLPPRALSVVNNQLRILRSLCPSQPDPKNDGFVGYVEPQDTLETVESTIGRSLTHVEGVFREEGCLVGVVLWGNSGAGITLVCPKSPNHAVEVAWLLTENLPIKEKSDDKTTQP